MGMSELRSPQCYLHSDYKSQIVDGRINRKKCTVCEFNFCKQVSNDSKDIFQHSNSDIKQKEINWSFIQIKPVIGQKTNSL